MGFKSSAMLLGALSLSLVACAARMSPQEMELVYRSRVGIIGMNTGSPGDVIIAAADGKVDYVSSNANLEQVFIYHGRDQDGLHMRTKYAYHRELFVEEGDLVTRGQEIGIVGGIKRQYLHFGVSKSPENLYGASSVWIYENPHDYWIDGIGKITCFQSGRDYPQNFSLKLTWPLKCR